MLFNGDLKVVPVSYTLSIRGANTGKIMSIHLLLMKDSGKWNGSINYINGTKMEGIISRYEKVSGYNNYAEKLLRIWFRDISGVQDIVREKS